MSKICGIPSPTNRGPKIHLFGRLRNLTATLMAYIFGTKQDIDNRSSALTTKRGLLHCPKYHELWHTNGFKLDRHFYPSYANSAFYVNARLRRRRSANRTQPNFAKRRTANRANICHRTVGVVSPHTKKWGPRNVYICLVFRRLRQLMANIF